MSDSGSAGVSEILGDIAGDVGDAVADTLGAAVKTSFGKTNPSQNQTSNNQSTQKTPEEQRQINFTRARLNQLAQAQALVRQKNTQQENQRLQAEAQEAQAEADESRSSQTSLAVPGSVRQDLAENMAELKGGRKGG